MECPACKSEDAYIGLSNVDCINPDCVHFKQSYLEEKLKEAEQDLDNIVEDLGLGDELHTILGEMWLREYDRVFSEWFRRMHNSDGYPHE